MLVKVLSGTIIGLDGVLVEVEVDVANKGFPTFTIVGLPNKSIDEAKDRVRTAITNTFFEMPDSRLTINLAPADIPKKGSGFDLPIAIGILAACGNVKTPLLANSLFIGELSLQGDIREVQGIIPIALLAKQLGLKNLFLPKKNIHEGILIEGINLYPIETLHDLVEFLRNKTIIHPYIAPTSLPMLSSFSYEYDFSDIVGHSFAKRALEIAAAGFHNVILKGSPGTGKTMLCRAFPSILPSLQKDEIIEVSRIYSVAGLLTNTSIVRHRPFRSPHHTTSKMGLIGGGTNPTPGEITLAHRGVLFLDELPEFPRSILEALRQPIEDYYVTISRASGSVTFPSRFLFLAAYNPCPCGYFGHPKKQCVCYPAVIAKYKKRLSGPLLDRIDLHISVSFFEEEKLLQSSIKEESSHLIKQRVKKAREVQKKRFQNMSIKTNGEMRSKEIKKFCKLSQQALHLIKHAMRQLSLSPRSALKIIKVAQTIADFDEQKEITEAHIAEALQYRMNDE